MQSLWAARGEVEDSETMPRGTGPEIYPSNDGKNPSFGRVFPSGTGSFPSQTNVQSLWVSLQQWMDGIGLVDEDVREILLEEYETVPGGTGFVSVKIGNYPVS